MAEKISLAVVGAASLAGEAVLSMLAERQFPLADLYAVDFVEQAGSHVEFKDDPLVIHELAEFDFEQVTLAIFLTEASVSAEYVPKASGCGCIVIDASACFRYDEDVPLIVAGVNDGAIADYRERMIIAMPSSATSQLIKTIKPIYDAVGIESINVTVMMSVSEMGKPGQEELGRQTAQLLAFQAVEKKAFSEQIAFNIIAQSGLAADDGYSTDELDLIKGTQKVLINDRISILPTVVIVPVFFGHSEVISIRTTEHMGADTSGELLDNLPGLQLIKEGIDGRPTPITDASGKDEVVVGRIRTGFLDRERELSLCCVADNIRSGIALNSVQIAEFLVKDYL